ncbi:MAG: hypothetical protein ACRDMJ_11840, partial [Solirubrobacteraceae bacterium]
MQVADRSTATVEPPTARTLDDALAALDPADRALVALRYERGLDNERLARMSGIAEARLRARHARMLARLQRALGAPPEALLAQLGAAAQQAAAQSGSARESTPGAPRARGNQRHRRRLAGALAALTAL